MDIDLDAMRTFDSAFRIAEAIARNRGYTQIRVRRWQRRRGCTLHIVFFEPGRKGSTTYKITQDIKTKRRSANNLEASR